MHTTIHVAGDRLNISRGLFTGADLYVLAGIDPAHRHLLLELSDDRDVPLSTGDHIVITGRERFSIGDGACPAQDDPDLRKPVSLVMNGEPLQPNERPRHSKLTFEQLAGLDPHFGSDKDLFVELEDVPDAQVSAGMRVLVQSEDRFYASPKAGFEIIVNARPRVVPDSRVTYEQLVALAFPDAQPEPNVVYSMTYRHAASKPHSGELGAGGAVEVKKKGSVFNVTRTVQS